MKRITYKRALRRGDEERAEEVQGYPVEVETPQGTLKAVVRAAPQGSRAKWEVDDLRTGYSLNVIAPRGRSVTLKAALAHVAEQVEMRADQIAHAHRHLPALNP